jgi:hypothetical protein
MEVKEMETPNEARERIQQSMKRYHSGAFFQEIERVEGSNNTGHLTSEQLRNRMIESQNRQIAERAEELRNGVKPSDKVRNSPQGCNGCLWAGCECKEAVLYDPDDKGDCKAWAYYD